MEPVGGSGAWVGGSSSDSGPCRVPEFIGGRSGCGAQSMHVLSVGGPGSVDQHFFGEDGRVDSVLKMIRMLPLFRFQVARLERMAW